MTKQDPELSRQALERLEKTELVDMVLLALKGQQTATESMALLTTGLKDLSEKVAQLGSQNKSQEAELLLLRNKPPSIGFNEYQEHCQRTMRHDINQTEQVTMTALGLTGEAGEVADMVKKSVWHGHALDQTKFAKELGDVLWYLATLAKTVGLNLEDVAVLNISKLKARYPDGWDQEKSKNRVEE